MENKKNQLSKEDQEAVFQASYLENQSRELEQKLELVSQQILELEKFKEDLAFLSKSKSNKILSSLGKGVYLDTSLNNKKLFIQVGSNIVVRKTPEETILVIESQLKRLGEIKLQIDSQLSMFHLALSRLIEDIRSRRK